MSWLTKNIFYTDNSAIVSVKELSQAWQRLEYCDSAQSILTIEKLLSDNLYAEGDSAEIIKFIDQKLIQSKFFPKLKFKTIVDGIYSADKDVWRKTLNIIANILQFDHPKITEAIYTELHQAGLDTEKKWKLLKCLRYICSPADKILSLLQEIIKGSGFGENPRCVSYAIGAIGKTAARLRDTDETKYTQLLKFIKIIPQYIKTEYQQLEYLKCLRGDWDNRRGPSYLEEKDIIDQMVCLSNDVSLSVQIRQKAIEYLADLNATIFSRPGSYVRQKLSTDSHDPLFRSMAQADKTDWFQHYYETVDFKRQNLSVPDNDVIPELDFQQIELVDIETSQHNSDGQWIKYAGHLGYMKYAMSNYNTPNADIVPGIEKYVSCLGRDLGIPINEIKLGFNPENRRFFHVSFVYNESWGFQDLVDLVDFIKRPSIASQVTHCPYADSLIMSLYSELHNDFRFMPEHFNPEIFDVSRVYSWLICEEDHHGFNNIVVHTSISGQYFYYLIDYGAALSFLHRMCLSQPGTLSDQYIAEILRAPLTKFLRNIFLYKQLKTSSPFYKATIGLFKRFVAIDEAVFLQHTDFILQHGFFSPQQATVLNVYMALVRNICQDILGC